MIDFITWYFIAGFIAMFYSYTHDAGRNIDSLDYLVLFTVLCGGYISFYFMIMDIKQRGWWFK